MANDKQRRAFISYSRVNKEFATRLVKGLRSGGYPVWFDLLDIPTGSRWDDEVEKALRECSIFMIILTPASIASENVKDEIGYAIDHGKRILPVLLEDCDVPLRLRRFQYVDFTEKSFDEGFESAKELLGDLIDEASMPLAPKPPVVESLVDQKAEDERLAKARAESERKAKEDADRLATQKAEDERLAKSRIESERKAKEESDRLAAQKAEAERLAQARAESERKAKEESDRLTAQKAKVKSVDPKVETVSAPATQKKPVSKGLVIGVVAVAVLVIAGIGFSAFSKRGTPATEAPIVSASATKAKPANTQKPANTPKPPTATPIPVPVVLSVSEASQLSDSTSVKGFYTLSREQYTDDQLTQFTDNNKPFPLTLTDSIPLRLGWSNCAKTLEILEDNLLSTDYTFAFMGKTIPESDHASYDFTADTGDICRVTYIIIDQWVTGQYSVYQGVEQTETINDGYSDIEPFEQSNEYVITVP